MDSPSCSSSTRSPSSIARMHCFYHGHFNARAAPPSAFAEPRSSISRSATPQGRQERAHCVQSANRTSSTIERQGHAQTVNHNRHCGVDFRPPCPAHGGLASAPPAPGGRMGPVHPRPKAAHPARSDPGSLREGTTAAPGHDAHRSPSPRLVVASGGSVRDGTAGHREFPSMPLVGGIRRSAPRLGVHSDTMGCRLRLDRLGSEPPVSAPSTMRVSSLLALFLCGCASDRLAYTTFALMGGSPTGRGGAGVRPSARSRARPPARKCSRRRRRGVRS